jgi:hypothetical protein
MMLHVFLQLAIFNIPTSNTLSTFFTVSTF